MTTSRPLHTLTNDLASLATFVSRFRPPSFDWDDTKATQNIANKEEKQTNNFLK